MMDAVEYNPYKPFVPRHAVKIIIGNFPIGKFTNPERFSEIKGYEIDFYYGGAANRLWHLIGHSFGVELKTKKEILKFLTTHKTGIADIVKSCRRKNGSALDTHLYDKTYNLDLKNIIGKNNFTEFIFTSRHVYLEFRKHIGVYPHINHVILYSPSPNAVRGLVKNKEYLALKRNNPAFSVTEFRMMKYKQVFS